MRATNLQYRCPKEETPAPYYFNVRPDEKGNYIDNK
jgi:hypothetical protein